MRNASVAMALAVALLGAGCSSSPDQVITVAAAASMQGVMDEVEAAYEDDHTGVDVRVTAAGSATLAEQVRSGAPIDLLITADALSMSAVAEYVGEQVPLATNAPVVVLAPSTRATSIGSLDGSIIAVCEASQPCGASAWLVTSAAQVRIASFESSVAGVLTKVALGEVDAGVAYASTAAENPDLVTLSIPGAANVTVTAALVLEASPQAAELAGDLVEFLGSSAGRRILSSHGFEPVE